MKDTHAPGKASYGQVSFCEPTVVEQLTRVQVSTVKGLTVTGSMLDCQASLKGPLRVHNAIAGGRYLTSDAIHAATIGQPNTPTVLVLGSPAKGNTLLAQVPKQLGSFDQKIEAIEKDLAYISNHGTQIGHNARERVMELEYELEELQGKRDLLQKKYDELLNHYRESTRIHLEVEQTIHPGVVIEFANQQYSFMHQITGPLTIQCLSESELSITLGDQPARPLVDLLSAKASA